VSDPYYVGHMNDGSAGLKGHTTRAKRLSKIGRSVSAE